MYIHIYVYIISNSFNLIQFDGSIQLDASIEFNASILDAAHSAARPVVGIETTN